MEGAAGSPDGAGRAAQAAKPSLTHAKRSSAAGDHVASRTRGQPADGASAPSLLAADAAARSVAEDGTDARPACKRPRTAPGITISRLGGTSPIRPSASRPSARASAFTSVISPFSNLPLHPALLLPTPLARYAPRAPGSAAADPAAAADAAASAADADGGAALAARARAVHFLSARGDALAPPGSELELDAMDEAVSALAVLSSGRKRTPFAPSSLGGSPSGAADAAAISGLEHALSILPTQRGPSLAGTPVGGGGGADGDVPGQQRKQAAHKRRLQFSMAAGSHVPGLDALDADPLGGAVDVLHQHGTPARTEQYPNELFLRETPHASPSTGLLPPLNLTATPNSLKECFRLADCLVDAASLLHTQGEGGLEPPAAAAAPLVPPLPDAARAAPSAHAMGAAAVDAPAKPKRDRNKENGGKPGKPRICNCKNSKCIKLYCDCFSAGVFCVDGCKCKECLNSAEHEARVAQARKSIQERNKHTFTCKLKKLQQDGMHSKGCNCKNSRCVKKYCECYQAGVSCTEKCRCAFCANGKPGAEEPPARDGSQAVAQPPAADALVGAARADASSPGAVPEVGAPASAAGAGAATPASLPPQPPTASPAAESATMPQLAPTSLLPPPIMMPRLPPLPPDAYKLGGGSHPGTPFKQLMPEHLVAKVESVVYNDAEAESAAALGAAMMLVSPLKVFAVHDAEGIGVE